jgi:hypothetical protein
MNTRIGTSFGLALLLALGIIATMLALGMFSSSSKVGAAAVPIDHVVNAAVNSPNTPGELATFTITFQNASALSAGSGQLYVKFDSLISVPSTMEKERITISSSGGGTSNPLFDPSITTDSAGDTVVVLTIGDTDPGTAGTQNLAAWNSDCCTLSTNANNGHVLQFSSLAGIRNSTFPAAAAAWVDMSDDGVTYNSTPRAIPVFRWLSLSAGAAARGTVITVTGKGFASGGTATVFLDDLSPAANRAFLLDSAETVLGTSAAAISGGTFTSSFTVDTNFSVGNNSINAVDSTGVGASAPNSGARYTSQSMTLFGAISLSASSASRGASVTVTLSDFTGVGPVTLITIGGVPADLSGLTVAIANNTLSLGVTVPSTTPIGTQTVSVTATTEGVVGGVPSARVATIEVTGLTLVASPSTAVAGQAVTVSGSGFSTAGSTPAGAIATVTVGGIAQTLLSNGNAVTTVTMDNSGNLVASFGIPNNNVTRTPGTHVLRITDNNNRIGEAVITVPAKSLTLDPTTSKRSSTVNYTGTGYIASTTVTITYAGATVDTVTADSGGNITGSFTVPTGSGIPSANSVVAASTCTCSGTAATGGVATQLAGAATHSVPGAAITADPVTAASGQIIIISGTGFPGFVGLAALTIGGVSALPSPAPATNTDGIFTASALVPELAAGSQSLVATVGTGNTAVTATSSFTVSATVTAAAAPVPSATETVFADEIASDNLVRVWLFSNTTKEWSFFDPRPAFATANSLTEASSGNIVWVHFTADTTFQGDALVAGWNVISLD